MTGVYLRVYPRLSEKRGESREIIGPMKTRPNSQGTTAPNSRYRQPSEKMPSVGSRRIALLKSPPGRATQATALCNAIRASGYTAGYATSKIVIFAMVCRYLCREPYSGRWPSYPGKICPSASTNCLADSPTAAAIGVVAQTASLVLDEKLASESGASRTS
ncbi:hypothetical protein CPLU01_07436 [Colletotrichum plurivorum]|uniref:Uncharacterized protein n=1 Tax=Colletotrichum plurivorum TaxID=2175906 RepID=A0A8H6KGE8_9PEZI|nr:hypothetical protein CPLU01_07436 [Colletotrichum plurivorum]